MRFRNVCFTDYNFTNVDGNEYLELWKESFPVVCLVFQKERCPSTDKEHWQGYCRFSKQVSRSSMQRIFSGIHVEKRRGSESQAIAYVEKEETRIGGPWSFGERADPGKRNDMQDIQSLLDNGSSQLDIAQEHFGTWCRYERSFRKYAGMLAKPRQDKTYSLIYWGTPGTGKTRTVYDTYGYDRVYDMPRPNGGSFWFDGLTPGTHDVLLLDDFYGWLPLHLLLKLMDRYPMKVPVKGGMVEFNCKYLYITSNKPFTEWYDWSKLGHNLMMAFKRRLDEEVEFTTADLPDEEIPL